MFQRCAHLTGQPYPVFSVDICSASSVRTAVQVAKPPRLIQLVEIWPARAGGLVSDANRSES